jgi:hypothetical protein
MGTVRSTRRGYLDKASRDPTASFTTKCLQRGSYGGEATVLLFIREPLEVGYGLRELAGLQALFEGAADVLLVGRGGLADGRELGLFGGGFVR